MKVLSVPSHQHAQPLTPGPAQSRVQEDVGRRRYPTDTKVSVYGAAESAHDAQRGALRDTEPEECE
jgi:hypothetical protein